MKKKTYVLNKPALLTSKDSLLRFEGHNIVIPMAVLEDLENSLKSMPTARRAIARSLLGFLDTFDDKQLMGDGVIIDNGSLLRVTTNFSKVDIEAENLSNKDIRVIQTCKGLMDKGEDVILISNWKNVRMKAKKNGIKAEELQDRVFPSRKDQYKGYADVYCASAVMDRLYSNKRIDVSEIYEYENIEWVTNLYLNIKSDTGSSAMAYFDGNDIVLIERHVNPYGIKAKNVKQNFVIHALMDENTPIVIIKGNAGTGKTYCSLGCGLHQTDNGVYEQILIAKPTDTVDSEKIGFLPGDIEQKFDPYIDSIYDNLEVLYKPAASKYDDDKKMTYAQKRSAIKGDYFERGIIEIQPLGFIRGRSISKRFFIIDETQNIDPESIKSIVSRAGEGSKFIFLGDPSQIDAPDLSENYNGLVYLSEMMKGQSLCRQITLDGEKDTVRSPLAQLAVNILV